MIVQLRRNGRLVTRKNDYAIPKLVSELDLSLRPCTGMNIFDQGTETRLSGTIAMIPLSIFHLNKFDGRKTGLYAHSP